MPDELPPTGEVPDEKRSGVEPESASNGGTGVPSSRAGFQGRFSQALLLRLQALPVVLADRRFRLAMLPLLATLLVLAGAILLIQGKDGVFHAAPQSCLFSIPAEEGLFVLDRDFQLHKFRETHCEPGPVLRTAEGISAPAVPEFAEFIREWAGAVEAHPELPGMLSEIQLSRTRETVFYSRNGRLRIDVAHRQNRRWPHTLYAALRAAEARGWSAGYMDLKDEDGLFIRER